MSLNLDAVQIERELEAQYGLEWPKQFQIWAQFKLKEKKPYNEIF